MSREAQLRELRELAWLLDESITIPIIRYKVGLDGVLGLIPGIGDFLGFLPGAYIIYKGWRFGVDPDTLYTMIFNSVLEAAIGTIPIFGDIFDFVYKSNKRNIKLIEKHLALPKTYDTYARAH